MALTKIWILQCDDTRARACEDTFTGDDGVPMSADGTGTAHDLLQLAIDNGWRPRAGGEWACRACMKSARERARRQRLAIKPAGE